MAKKETLGNYAMPGISSTSTKKATTSDPSIEKRKQQQIANAAETLNKYRDKYNIDTNTIRTDVISSSGVKDNLESIYQSNAQRIAEEGRGTMNSFTGRLEGYRTPAQLYADRLAATAAANNWENRQLGFGEALGRGALAGVEQAGSGLINFGAAKTAYDVTTGNGAVNQFKEAIKQNDIPYYSYIARSTKEIWQGYRPGDKTLGQRIRDNLLSNLVTGLQNDRLSVGNNGTANVAGNIAKGIGTTVLKNWVLPKLTGTDDPAANAEWLTGKAYSLSDPIDNEVNEFNFQLSQSERAANIAGKTTEVIGAMLPSIATSYITGSQDAGLTLMAAQAAGNAAKEAYLNGASAEEAYYEGMATGSVEYLTEMMFGGIEALGKGVLSQGAKKAVGDFARSRIGGLLFGIGDRLGENVEEAVSDWAAPGIKKAVYGTVSQEEEKTLTDALLGQAPWTEEGLVTLLTTMILGGMNSAVQGIAKIPAEQAQEIINVAKNTGDAKLSSLADQYQAIIDKRGKLSVGKTNNIIDRTTARVGGAEAYSNALMQERRNRQQQTEMQQKTQQKVSDAFKGTLAENEDHTATYNKAEEKARFNGGIQTVSMFRGKDDNGNDSNMVRLTENDGRKVEMTVKEAMDSDALSDNTRTFIKHLSILGSAAPAAYEAYDGKLSGGEYAQAMSEAINLYAANGANLQEVVKKGGENVSISRLSEAQLSIAQDLGGKIYQQKTVDAQELSTKYKAQVEAIRNADTTTSKDLTELTQSIADIRGTVKKAQENLTETLERLEGMDTDTDEYEYLMAEANSYADTVEEGGRVLKELEAAKKEAEQKKPEQRRKGTVSFAGNEKMNAEHKAVDKENLTEAQKKQVKAVEAIADVFHLDYVLYESDAKGDQGYFIAADGKVYININAGGGSQISAVATLSHELTHALQTYSPKYYDELRNEIVKIYFENDPAKFEKIVRQHMNAEGLKYDEAVDELVANTCTQMLNDSDAIHQLARDNMNLAEKILDDLKKIIKDAFAGINAHYSEEKFYQQYRNQFEKAIKLWEQAIADAAENVDAGIKISADDGGTKFMAWEEQREMEDEGIIVSSGPSAKNKVGLSTVLSEHIDELSEMKPVARLTGKEMNDRSKKLSEQILDFFDSFGNYIERTGFGKVHFGDYGMGGILNHKPLNRAKVVTISAVPAVIEHGKKIGYSTNWKGRGYASYTFAAPVDIAGKTVYVAAAVDVRGENEFYVNECVDSEGNYIRISAGSSAYTKSGVTDNGITSPAEEPALDASVSQNQPESKGKPAKNAQEPYKVRNQKWDSKVEEAAVKRFGTTEDFNEAGYILPNGKMLRFTNDQHIGTREYDHRAIAIAYGKDVDLNLHHGYTKEGNYLERFVNDGGIRIEVGDPDLDIDAGIQLSAYIPPTEEQMRRIRDFLDWKKNRDEGFTGGEYSLFRGTLPLGIDFGGDSDIAAGYSNRESSRRYVGDYKAEKVINDIKAYYSTGSIPEQSVVSQFHTKYQKYDSTGEELSVEQEKYFRKSKVRDALGNLLRLFHGTHKWGFTVFDNKYSDDGLSFFMTDNLQMAQSYSSTETVKSAVSGKVGSFEEAVKSLMEREPNAKVYTPEEVKEWAEHAKKSALAVARNAQKVIDSGEFERVIAAVPENSREFNSYAREELYTMAMFNGTNIDRTIEALERLEVEPAWDYEGSLEWVYNHADSKIYDDPDNNNLEYGPGLLYEKLMELKPLEAAAKHGERLVSTRGADGYPYTHFYTEREIMDKTGYGGWANYPLYADIRNPVIIDAKGGWWNSIYWEGEAEPGSDTKLKGTEERTEWYTRAISKVAHENGYDGVIIRNLNDDGGMGTKPASRGTVVIAFRPEQIKDAYNKNPTTNPDIRFQKWIEGQMSMDEWQQENMAETQNNEEEPDFRKFDMSAMTVKERRATGEKLVNAVKKLFDRLPDYETKPTAEDIEWDLEYDEYASGDQGVIGMDAENILWDISDAVKNGLIDEETGYWVMAAIVQNTNYLVKNNWVDKFGESSRVEDENFYQWYLWNVDDQEENRAGIAREIERLKNERAKLQEEFSKLLDNYEWDEDLEESVLENRRKHDAINEDIDRLERQLNEERAKAGIRYQKWTDEDGYTDDELKAARAADVRIEEENILLGNTIEDLTKEVRKLADESANRAETIDKLRRELKETKTPEAREKDAEKLARKLISKVGSAANVDEVTSGIKDVADYLIQNIGEDIDPDVLTQKSTAIAKNIVEQAIEKIEPTADADALSEIKKAIKGKRMYIAPEARSDLDVANGYNRFRTRNMSRFTLVNDKTAQSVDSVYEELKGNFGTHYFPEMNSEGEMLMVMADIFDTATTQVVNPYKNDKAQIIREVANDIYYGAIEDIRQAPATMADKLKAAEDQLKYVKRELGKSEKAGEKQDAKIEKLQEKINTLKTSQTTANRLSKAIEKQAAKYEKLLAKKDERIATVREQGKARIEQARAKEKAAKWEKVRELREYYQDKERRAAEKRKESAGISKYRRQVTEKATKLTNMLLENSDKRHVPEPLKKPLTEFLESINFDSARKLAGGENTQADNRFAVTAVKLKNILENQQKYLNGEEGTDPEYGFGGYIDIAPDALQVLKDMSDEVLDAMDTGRSYTVNQMSAEELKNLSNVLSALYSGIRNMNSFMANERYASVREAADADIEHLAKLGKAKDNEGNLVKRFLKWQDATPFYAMKRFGKGGEAIFEGLTKGWEKMAMNVKEIIEFTKNAYTTDEVNAWKNDIRNIKLEDGSEIRMSVAQIMAFSQLLSREQALKHMEHGGVRIGNIQGKKGEIVDTAHYHFSEADIQNMLKMLNDRQMEVATKLRKYMGKRGGELGNEVSERRFGYDFFTEGESYFPIATDSNDRPMADTDAKSNDMFRLLNLGATKSLNPHASNALVVNDIFDVFADHMSDMAKYNGMGLSILDAIKWFNFKERTDNEDGTYDVRSMQSAIETAFGTPAGKYFRTLIKDINGVREGGDRASGVRGLLTSNYKISAVGANLRVALLQPTSYVRASAVIKPKYLLAAFKQKNASAEALKYSGTAQWKSLGFYDTNISRNMREQIEHADTWKDKAIEASMKGAEIGDSRTWGRLWAAAKMQVQAEHPRIQEKELLKKTTDLFRQTIYATQVMDSTLTRSELMRSTAFGDKTLTAFMAEPTVSYNILMDAYTDYQLDSRENGKDGALRRNAPKLQKAFAVYAASATFAAIMESFVDAMRDSDDEEFWQKFLQAFLGEGDNAIEKFYDSNIGSDFSLIGKIPLAKNIISFLQGYNDSDMSTEGLANLINAFNVWKETIELQTGALEEPTKVTYYGRMTDWGKIYKTLQAVSMLSGLPVSAGARDALAIWNTTVGGVYPEIKVKTYDDNALSGSKLSAYKEFVEPTGMKERQYNKIMKEANTNGNTNVSQDELGTYLMQAEATGELTDAEIYAIWMSKGWKTSYQEWKAKQ